jgi:hypothetical protein
MRGWGVGISVGAGVGEGKEDSTPMNADRKGMNADVPEQPVLPCVELDARTSLWHAASVFIPADRCSSVLSLACFARAAAGSVPEAALLHRVGIFSLVAA